MTQDLEKLAVTYGRVAAKRGLGNVEALLVERPGTLVGEFTSANGPSQLLTNAFKSGTREAMQLRRALVESEPTLFPSRRHDPTVIAAFASALCNPATVLQVRDAQQQRQAATDMAALGVFLGARVAHVRPGKEYGFQNRPPRCSSDDGGVVCDLQDVTVVSGELEPFFAAGGSQDALDRLEFDTLKRLQVLQSNRRGSLLRGGVSAAVRCVEFSLVQKFDLIVVEEDTAMDLVDLIALMAVTESMAIVANGGVLKGGTFRTPVYSDYFLPAYLKRQPCPPDKRVADFVVEGMSEVASAAPLTFSFRLTNKPIAEPSSYGPLQSIGEQTLRSKGLEISDREKFSQGELRKLKEERERSGAEQSAREREEVLASADRELQKYLLNDRGVQHFVHFTNTGNLPSILRNGLIPRSQLGELERDTPDALRLDRFPSRNCISISYPNWFFMTFCIARTENPIDRKDLVVLMIDAKSVLSSGCSSALTFYPTNAASRQYRDEDQSIRRGVAGAKKLFEPELCFESWSTTREAVGIPAWCPTDPQAEVQYEGVIPSAWIESAVPFHYGTFGLVEEIVAGSDVKPYRVFRPHFQDASVTELPSWWETYRDIRRQEKSGS